MTKVYASSLDLGTMFLQSAREKENGEIVYNTVRDCYLELPWDDDFEDILKTQKVHYIRDHQEVREARKLYILGEDAYRQAGMAEFTAKEGDEILKRPMRDGILNPTSPKMSIQILRELMKACIEKDIGPARPGEILYFSIPANPVDSPIDNTFHMDMAQQYLRSLSYDARPLGEGLAVVYSECPKMMTKDGPVPFTGVGISFGAGQANFCLAERGRPIDEFSVARSGDWIDAKAATMTGEPRTKVLRMKERKLDFNKVDLSDPVLMALTCYYENLVKYIFSKFAERFSSNKGAIDDPIEIVLSGGTASVPGFGIKVNSILQEMNLPFKIHAVRLAGNGVRDDMLKTVAKGCYIRAKRAAKKMAQAKDALNSIEKKK